LPLRVADAVRKAVGDDFTVGVRLCADEQFWGGIALEESLPVAQELERTGCADFIEVAVGTYYNLHIVMPSHFSSRWELRKLLVLILKKYKLEN